MNNRTESDRMSVLPLMIAHGMADSMVPTGQRRQKYNGDAVVKKMGTATTSPRNTPYLTNLVHDGKLNFT